MARFGQSFINSLINPSYAEGLQGVGMLAGSLSGRKQEAREEEARKQRERQMAMLEAGGESITANAQAARQRQQSALLGDVMTAPEGIAQIAQRGAAKANIPIAQITAAAKERRAANTEAQSQQQNKAIASFFTGQERPDLAELAAQGVIPASSVKDFLKLSEEEVKVSFSAGKNDYMDDKGNYYSVTTSRDPNTGQTKTQYSPITPGAPAVPEGPITPVGGAYGESAEEKRQRQIAESGGSAQAKKYGEARVTAITSMPSLASAAEGFDRALELLDTVETGGVVNTAGTALERFFGTMSGDKAELNLRLGLEMFSQLKPLFGGVISEGEREAVVELYANLKKGNPANAAIVRALREKTKMALDSARIMSKAATLEDYNDKMSKLYPEEPTQERVYQWGAGAK